MKLGQRARRPGDNRSPGNPAITVGAREKLYATDWINVGALLDELFDIDLMRLDGDEKLAYYVRNEPEMILNRDSARKQVTCFASKGSRVHDPWEFVRAMSDQSPRHLPPGAGSDSPL